MPARRLLVTVRCVKQPGFVEMAVLGGLLGHDPFTGQCAGYEQGLAVTARHAMAIVAVVDDLGFKRGFVDAWGAGSCHVAGAACDCGAVLSQKAGRSEGESSSFCFDSFLTPLHSFLA